MVKGKRGINNWVLIALTLIYNTVTSADQIYCRAHPDPHTNVACYNNHIPLDGVLAMLIAVTVFL